MAVRERSIYLKPWEPRVLLMGRKTQLWRPITLGRSFRASSTPGFDFTFRGTRRGARTTGTWQDLKLNQVLELCPYGSPGDMLIGKEAFRAIEDPGANDSDVRRTYSDEDGETHYVVVDYRVNPPKRIMDELGQSEWKSAACMPAWAARFRWKVKRVIVSLVREISEENALATGGWLYSDCPIHKEPVRSLAELWKHDYPQHPWETSWAWGVEVETKS